MMYEYCERGSLTGVLAAARHDPAAAAHLPWRRRLSMVRALARCRQAHPGLARLATLPA